MKRFATNGLAVRMARWLLLIACVVAGGVMVFHSSTPTSAQGTTCFTETLPNGAKWDMCWEFRAIEGIVLHDIKFTPPAGTQRLILSRAHVAQIHVPYDDNAARFHDVTDYGLGNNINSLTQDDCPGGVLWVSNSKNVLCKKVVPTGYSYKFYGTQKQGNAMVLFSVSHISQYNYISQWEFSDDGTIAPSIGATGRLQKCTADANYGWPIGPTSNCAAATPRGTSHIHNYYWYLDFDLGTSSGDVLEEIAFGGSGASTRTMTVTPYTTETARTFSQNDFRRWRVKDTGITNSDGHAISYEIEGNSSHVFRGPATEPFTNNDIYATQYSSCELFASHNNTVTGCGGADVSSFVNGQAISDLVVFYRSTFHHLTRDEDDHYMSPHWDKFYIVPRDMTATNPR